MTTNEYHIAPPRRIERTGAQSEPVGPGTTARVFEFARWVLAWFDVAGTGRPACRRVGPLRTHRFGHGDDDGDEPKGPAVADVLDEVRRRAGDVHQRLAHDHGIDAVEVLGSTGSGKTRLIERLVERRPDDERIAAVVGDVAGDEDARRLSDLGVETVDVATGRECHLDPATLDEALDELHLPDVDRLYVENVGNMVCPADFPLGTDVRMLVVSTTEGDDVVRKHPTLFRACDVAVVNKTDLDDAVGADVERMLSDVGTVAPELPVLTTSAKRDEGIDALGETLAAIRATHPDRQENGLFSGTTDR
jgi:hydrogenase nickel incorporation protein HypB